MSAARSITFVSVGFSSYQQAAGTMKIMTNPVIKRPYAARSAGETEFIARIRARCVPAYALPYRDFSVFL
jgi:hypothetical protein